MKQNNTKKYSLTAFIASLLIIGISFNGCQSSKIVKSNELDLINYVNPLIGTAGSTTISALQHGSGTENNAQVYPAVTVPFGMTNWTPQTQNTENKCLAPYYYKDDLITGFRGSHWLSGSCTQDYGTIAIMPVSGKLICNPWKRGSKYSHNEETASPDYYKINLVDYKIEAEMSATTRCGILRFTFENDGDAHIVINPNSDKGVGSLKIIPENNEVICSNPIFRIYQGWGKSAGFSGNFVIEVQRKIENYGAYSINEIFPNQLSIEQKNNIGVYLSFKVKKGEQILIKIGSSFVSVDQARKNLETEIPGFDFDLVKENLREQWENLLSKIKVEGDIREDKIKFYTAMYHSFLQPRIYNDVDGSYPRFDGNTKTDTIKNGNYYCDFSLWDTYRALHPLYNILIPKQNKDMLRSLIRMAKAGGWLPIFPKWNNYTAAMIGDHAIAAIAEAYVKGTLDLSEIDYSILKKNATESPASFEEYKDGKGRRALNSYLKYGYIPLEDSVKEAFHKNEQVSRTLEYAYDDYALAQIAKKMNKMDDYKYFMSRAQNYRNVFDPSVNNMNGRYKDGSFNKDFVKDKPAPFVTEGTPWQYNWYVPQDVAGLMELMGGKKAFNQELDKFFAAGQYWHGNEPSHQIAFLYNLSDQPWKTQKNVNDVLNTEYGVGPGGLSGNDDAGQMSAWYILGAIGIYPVCPASGEYQLSGPKFKKIVVKLGNGKELEINSPNYSPNNIFIRKYNFDGKEQSSYSVTHEQLMNGGRWYFDLTDCYKE
jgi:predicted alpha-1,2-mannosidase